MLIQATGMKAETAYVIPGYRDEDKDKDNLDIDIKRRRKFKSLTHQDSKHLKRRPVIDPFIGYLKADHQMNWSHLKGSLGGSYTRSYALGASTSAGCCA